MSPDNAVIPQSSTHRWQLKVWIGAALFFLLPVIGQLAVDGFRWGPGDFVMFATMLVVLCSLYEVASRISGSLAYRTAAGIVLLSCFALVFINLAVGIIGSEDHPANMMYFAVVLPGFLAALFVRFSPAGMVRVMIMMGVAQIIVAIVGASVAWTTPDADPNRPLGTLVLSGAFALAWLLSAYLFNIAAKTEKTPVHAV